MAFEWQAPPSLDPSGNIAALMLRGPDALAQATVEAARARAQGVAGAGQAWGQAISGAGQAVQSGIQQATDPRRQMEQQQVADLKSLDKAYNEKGGREAVLNALPGHLRPQVAAGFAAADESASKAQEQQLKADAANTDYIHTLAEQIKANGYSPASLQLAISHARQTFGQNQGLLGQLTPIESSLHANPTAETVQSIIDPILKAHEAGEKPVILPATPRGGAPAQLVKPGSGEVVAAGQAAPAQPPTEPELALQAAGGDPTAAMNILKPKPVRAPLSLDEQMAEAVKANDTTTIGLLQKALTLTAQAKQDPMAARQLIALNATIAQQQRAQDFQVTQVARKELVDKVEAPYQTAKTSADTLRDVVAAAQSGNKTAAALQSLEATMAAIRAQGLNRINTAEIGVTANAGSIFDRIQNAAGRISKGQPVDADLQKDMLGFADILDKAAYRKYSDAFDSVSKFYKLTDEQKSLKSAPPNSPEDGTARTVNGQSAVWKNQAGTWGWWPK